jgi:hypothetical protein
MDDWAKRRLAELQAAPPAKRKRAAPFVKVPLWWIEETAKLTKSPTTLVLMELLRLHWKTNRALATAAEAGRTDRARIRRFRSTKDV